MVEDEFGLIIHHKIAWKQTDDKVAIPIMKESKKLFVNLKGCSFDKGFYSQKNKKRLIKLLLQVVLPKKGRRSKAETEEETSEAFIKARKSHSAVESAIASLQNHGLSRCPDRGKPAFERYVALGVLAFNVHKLGSIIQKKARKAEKHRERYLNTYWENRNSDAA